MIGTYSPLKKKKILAGRMDEATLRPMGVLAPKLHNIFIWDNYTKPTCDLGENHFAYPWLDRRAHV